MKPGPTSLGRFDRKGSLPIEFALSPEYEILDVLGRGGFAITCQARDRILGLDVAIKEYFPTDLAMRGEDLSVEPTPAHQDLFEWGKKRFIFIQESPLLAGLKHDAIVRLFRVFEDHNTVYSVLELVKGQSLGRSRSLARAG